METENELNELLEQTDRDFVLTRLFNAPREKVFDAWTQPEKLMQWFGPKGFTTPVCNVDLRAGGHYRIVMRSSEGVDYPVKGVYRAVVPPDLLIYDENLEEHPQAWFDDLRKSLQPGEQGSFKENLTAVTFKDEAGKTRVTVHTRFDTKAERDAMVKMGMPDGWEECFQRLDALLASK